MKHTEETKKTISEKMQGNKNAEVWDVDSDGKLAILPKYKVRELLGRSPDYADALMMRMYFELVPKTNIIIF